MRPGPSELLHFSEDPSIRTFELHVARTAQQPESYVWAVDASLAPAYWFPRECPRAMAWVASGTTDRDRDRVLGPGGGDRVHAVEYAWLDAFRSAQLYAYRLPAAQFRPFGHPRPHAWVSTEAVRPLSEPQRVPDLLSLHEEAGIQLRVLPDLWPFWDVVITSSLDFSGIRLRNARRRDPTNRCAIDHPLRDAGG